MSSPTLIALVGFRASGKSLVGRLLAEALRFGFVDMDEMLTAHFGDTIADWVRKHGWESFRAAEGELLNRLAFRRRLVVATGGGVVMNAQNRILLHDHFFVVWLRTSPEVTISRLTMDSATESNRPALTNLPLKEEIEKILNERWEYYAEIAELILDTDEKTPSQLVSSILGRLEGGGWPVES